MVRQEATSPKVSILVPTYNRENFIGACIQSALNQTYPDIEVIVVDNASTDGTWEIIQKYAKKDRRIKAFRNEINIGPVRNWKRCIDEANGFYGKLLFSDDIIESEFVEKTLPFLIKPDVGFVFSSVNMGFEPGKGCINYKYADETGMYATADFITASLFGGDVPISPGCAIFRIDDLKRNLLLDIPSPTINDFLSHGAGPDLLLYLLTAKAYSSFAFVNEPLCFFRAHEGSISISDKNQYLSRCYIQAKIWFAETYLDSSRIRKYYVYAWYEHCRLSHNWEMSSGFLGRYTMANGGLLFPSLIGLIASRVFLKIKLLTKQVLQ